MSTSLQLLIIVLSFSLLLLISRYTSRHSRDNTFFVGDRKSPGFLVAICRTYTSPVFLFAIQVCPWIYEYLIESRTRHRIFIPDKRETSRCYTGLCEGGVCGVVVKEDEGPLVMS